MERIKGYIKIFLVIMLFLMTVESAYAWVALPTLSIKGEVKLKPATDSGDDFQIAGGTITEVSYRDRTSLTSNNKFESIINADVLITGSKRTGDYTFTNAELIIRNGNFIYLKATLVNIAFVTDGVSWYLNPEIDVADGATMNLRDIQINISLTYPSKYMEELTESLKFINKAGIKIVLIPSAESDIKGNFSGMISSGLIAGPLYLSEPVGVRTKDYWETHYIERGIFGYNAVSNEIDVLDVFKNQEALDSLFLKGKNKTLLEEAKTQLAVLLLNVSAGLDPSTKVNSIFINPKFAQITQGDGIEDSVRDVILDIENTILHSANSKRDIERVKNLVEGINSNNFQ